jgi:hypothetical protein
MGAGKTINIDSDIDSAWGLRSAGEEPATPIPTSDTDIGNNLPLSALTAHGGLGTGEERS